MLRKEARLPFLLEGRARPHSSTSFLPSVASHRFTNQYRSGIKLRRRQEKELTCMKFRLERNRKGKEGVEGDFGTSSRFAHLLLPSPSSCATSFMYDLFQPLQDPLVSGSSRKSFSSSLHPSPSQLLLFRSLFFPSPARVNKQQSMHRDGRMSRPYGPLFPDSF